MNSVTAPPAADPVGAAEGSPQRSKLDQWICVCSYPSGIAIAGIAFFVAELLPPIPPTAGKEAVAKVFTDNSTAIGIAVILLLLAIGAQMPFMGLIVAYMRQMSGPGRLLSYVYIASYGAATIPGANLCTLAWAAAAFRPNRDPELVMLLDDLAYLGFITVIGGFLLPYLCLGLAIMCDRGRVLPLWVGYVCAWEVIAELLFLPLHIFKVGPFAWNGILSFWVGLTMFAVWLLVMTAAMTSATRRNVLEQNTPIARVDARATHPTP